MEAREVIERIRAVVPESAQVQVDGADCDFTAIVLSDSFAGVSPVKRQQSILAQFSDVLASGELHALSVKAHTVSEWNAKQGQSLTQLSL